MFDSKSRTIMLLCLWLVVIGVVNVAGTIGAMIVMFGVVLLIEVVYRASLVAGYKAGLYHAQEVTQESILELIQEREVK